MNKHDCGYYVFAYFDLCGWPLYIGLAHEGRHRRPRNKALLAAMAACRQQLPLVRMYEAPMRLEQAKSIAEAFISAIGCKPDGPLLNACDELEDELLRVAA